MRRPPKTTVKKLKNAVMYSIVSGFEVPPRATIVLYNTIVTPSFSNDSPEKKTECTSAYEFLHYP